MHRNATNDETIRIAKLDEKVRVHCANLDVNDPDDASFILRAIWVATRPRAAKCLEALTTNPGLYAALKHAHTKRRSYDVIRNWCKSP